MRYLPDHPLCFVMLDYGGLHFAAERDVADMTREGVIADILAGTFTRRPNADHVQVSTLLAVFECDMRTGAACNVTAEIASDVRDTWADAGEELADWQKNFIADHLGAAALARFEREFA